MQAQGSCCPPGSWPALNAHYEAKGQILELGTKVYHIGSGSRVLILLSDIYGAFSGRHQGVADTFASFGYNVYVPQLLNPPFQGQDLSNIGAYLATQKQETIEPIFHQLLQHLEKQGHKHYFLAGFCWGVWEAFKLAVRFDGAISIVGFHPSLIVEHFLGGSEVKLTESIKAPAFLFPAGNDPANVKERGEIIKILQAKFGEEKAGTFTFPNAVHGWVVRGDIHNENVRKDVESAIQLAVNYLEKFKI